VATKTEKGNYHTAEIQLAKPAASGHVRLKWRPDITSTFQDLASFTADGTNTSFETDIGLTDLENIQVQVEYDGEVELMEVRLLP
jgi:hypothetical protein